MRKNRIATLNNYHDWLEKAKHELYQFEKSCGVYDMANCFLTLNAIPEWVEKSNIAPTNLKELARKKINIMKGINFTFDEYKLNELDHQLRLVRLFCNHSKHGDPKKKLKEISMNSHFPLKFPVKFESLPVGSINIKTIDILKNTIAFWSQELESPKNSKMETT